MSLTFIGYQQVSSVVLPSQRFGGALLIVVNSNFDCEMGEVDRIGDTGCWSATKMLLLQKLEYEPLHWAFYVRCLESFYNALIFRHIDPWQESGVRPYFYESPVPRKGIHDRVLYQEGVVQVLFSKRTSQLSQYQRWLVIIH